ncbi:hypothetical protein D5S18_08965 [Nocardia panacis]|uniref:Integral membrane protein n=2 Tax=Nocardia panacis TaxID=2340916 RepID=A0A3A4K5Z4_9NOCA|nr:hypothetical protein D5S18_08965 [Nocardia panacis]
MLLVGQAVIMALLLAGNWHPVRAAVYVAIFVATAVGLFALGRRRREPAAPPAEAQARPQEATAGVASDA